MKQQKNKKIKLKERRQHIFKCEEPDLQESAIFKKIVAYQQKLLVRRIFEISCFHNFPFPTSLSLKEKKMASNIPKKTNMFSFL